MCPVRTITWTNFGQVSTIPWWTITQISGHYCTISPIYFLFTGQIGNQMKTAITADQQGKNGQMGSVSSAVIFFKKILQNALK